MILIITGRQSTLLNPKETTEPVSNINSDVVTQSCQFRLANGAVCENEVEEGEYCKWHDNEQVLIDPALRLNLQIHAMKVPEMRNYQLANADLSDIDLIKSGDRNGFHLIDADLYRANLSHSQLFKLDLSGSSLMKANLKEANLNYAILENANLLGAHFDNCSLDGVVWGDKVLQEIKSETTTDPEERQRIYHEAEDVYRNLCIEHDRQGHSNTAGYFFRREMIMRRYQLPLFSFKRLISKVIDLFTGYGEQPAKIIAFSISTIFLFAFMYAIIGVSDGSKIIQFDSQADVSFNVMSFLNCLYYSVVTFTTMGYGDIVPVAFTRFLAASEAFVGAFTMALFVVIVAKKTSR